jgi:hypothetical protein
MEKSLSSEEELLTEMEFTGYAIFNHFVLFVILVSYPLLKLSEAQCLAM